MKTFFTYAAALVASGIQSISVGVLWRWFVTPEFGIESPGFLTIWGLLIMLSALRQGKYDKDIADNAILHVVHSIVVSLLAVVFGFVLFSFS